MTKLSQIVAVEKGIKSRTTRDVTNAYRLTHIAEPLTGLSRSYKPRDEEGEQLPSEVKRVQHTIAEINAEVERSLVRLFDVTATKDWANTTAKADIVVDGGVLVADVPVPYLLFLEKQLNDLRTYVEQLPVLDPSETWLDDDQPGVYRTEPTQTTRTRKVPRNHILYEATDKHPAQVETYTEDVVIGDYTLIKRSGALRESDRAALVERVDTLQLAVKYAREQANSAEVTDIEVGRTLLSYIFDARLD